MRSMLQCYETIWVILESEFIYFICLAPSFIILSMNSILFKLFCLFKILITCLWYRVSKSWFMEWILLLAEQFAYICHHNVMNHLFIRRSANDYLFTAFVSIPGSFKSIPCSHDLCVFDCLFSEQPEIAERLPTISPLLMIYSCLRQILYCNYTCEF